MAEELKATYVVAVCGTAGEPIVMYGPFLSMDEATEWMNDPSRDTMLADMEQDQINDERNNADWPFDGEDVDTKVMLINAPEALKVGDWS